MVRPVTRHINKRGAFTDLSVGIEFHEEAGALFARVTFSATLGTRRKTTRVNVDLNEALDVFKDTLPIAGQGNAFEKPITIIHEARPQELRTCIYCGEFSTAMPGIDCPAKETHASI